MLDFHNPYVRLETYLSLFAENDSYDQVPTYSLAELSERSQIPLPKVRRDFLSFYRAKRISFWSPSYSEDASDYDNECLDMWDATNSSEVEKKIINGAFDDMLFTCKYTDEQSILTFLMLTGEEYRALQTYISELSHEQNAKVSFDIKNSYRFQSNKNLDKMFDIIAAIEHKKALEIDYCNAKHETSTIRIYPLKIIYDSVENNYAILCMADKQPLVYRLDRIRSLRSCKASDAINFSTKLDPELEKIIPHVWGMSFSSEPANVKVRFYNEGNVWKKVKNDLSYRTNGSLYEEDGFLYYEDTVYGLDAFRTWIYSFGSSAIVLEPVRLREQIIDSLIARWEEYKDF